MSKLKLGLIVIFFLITQGISFASAENSNTVYSASDREIESFLQQFITNSIANLTMLVEFVKKMLSDALGSNDRLVPINKINQYFYASTGNTTSEFCISSK